MKREFTQYRLLLQLMSVQLRFLSKFLWENIHNSDIYKVVADLKYLRDNILVLCVKRPYLLNASFFKLVYELVQAL